MKVVKNINLNNFKFWAGAKDTVAYLTTDELNTLDNVLEEWAEETDEGYMHEVEINDFFWFDTEKVANILGYDSFDDIMEERPEITKAIMERRDAENR